MKIIKYNSPKNSDTTESRTETTAYSGVTQSASTDEASKLAATHTLWGQSFNGTQDVSGDINNAKNINATGVTVKSTTDADGTYGGNITADGTITGKDITSTEKVTTPSIEATTGTITTLSGDSETFKQAIIDALQSTNITTDNLTVTKKAHFFSLIIDEIKSVGGQVILSPANATIDLVETLDNSYRCYFKAKDGDGKQIFNQFVANDQAICQTFNVATGTSYAASNKYYWRLITGIGDTTKTINNVSTECHYIDFSKTDCDTNSSLPEVGDKIALLGNRTDTTRQAAIIISAYKSPDSTVEAPSIVQYSGINDYSLSTHKLNQIAKNGNVFKGDFYTSTGNNIYDEIENKNANNINGLVQDVDDKEYGASTDKSTQPTTWTTTMPELSQTNKYIWEKETITYKCINEDTRNILVGTSSDWQSNATYIQLTTYLGIDLTKSNGVITISFDAKAPDGNSSTNNYNFGIHLRDKNGVNLHDSGGNTSVIQNWTTVGHIPTDSTHYVYTIDLSSKITQSGHSVSEVGQMLVMLCYNGIADGSGCYTKNLKVSIGSTETDWTPAPEDLTKTVAAHIVAIYSEDTEFYRLYNNASFGAIDAAKNLKIKLNFSIVHVVGKTQELMATTPTGYKLYWSSINESGSYTGWNEFTSSLSNNCYTYTNTYASSTNIVNIEVDLNNSAGDTIDTFVIPVTLLASASFSVTDTINAAVQNNAGDITTLQQTASSLTSTISSLHTNSTNLFGFNKGINFNNTRPCPEFYGLAVSGKTGDASTNYRIENLGFNGTKGVNETYIVKCKIKMQTTARTLNINLCDVTARNGKSIFNATTDWKDFEGIFDNVNDYNYVGSSNGFLDIENDTESLTNWALVKDLQITKSNIASEFSIANEDSVSDKTNIISDWITNGVTVEDTKIDKYTVYKTNTNPSSSVNNINYYYKNNVTIKDNQTYTLSFWAKADKEAVISSFFYPTTVNPNIPDFCPMDGLTKTAISTDWKHYFVYWHTKLDTSATNYLVKNILPICLNYSTNSNNTTAVVEFYGISFMEGYVTEQSYYQSLIKQTADSIELKINNAGISLDDGTITLDAAKTNIKGNLSISQYTDGEGLTVYDSDAIPRIELRTDDLSDVTNLINGSSSSGSLSGYYNWIAQCGTEIHNMETDLSANTTVGTFKVKDTIDLSNIYIFFSGVNEYINYTVTLKLNGTNIATLGSGQLYGSAKSVKLSDYSYTVTTAGTYTVWIDTTLYVIPHDTAYTVHPVIYLDGSTKRVTSQEIILAKDGMAINCGINKWFYASDTEMQFRWGNDGIRLNDNGIYQLYSKPDGSIAWGAFSSKKHIQYVNNTTYTLTNDVDFVILAGSTSTLIIDTDQCMDGRYIRVKDMATSNGYINLKGTPIVYDSDSSKTTDTNRNIDLAGTKVRDYTYSSALSAWIVGYLS